MDALQATLAYVRCEQTLAEARMRILVQEQRSGHSPAPEVRGLLVALHESVAVLDERCAYLRGRMRVLNALAAPELESGRDRGR